MMRLCRREKRPRKAADGMEAAFWFSEAVSGSEPDTAGEGEERMMCETKHRRTNADGSASVFNLFPLSTPGALPEGSGSTSSTAKE
jgi:hypothetical protein